MSITIITKPRKLRSFIAFDLEWVPGSLELRMVGVYDGNAYRCYCTVSQFLSNELTSRNRGKWFFAHYGGIADMQFVLHEIRENLGKLGYTVRGSLSGSAAIIVRISKGHNVWYFIDSGRLLPGKLADIGKAIGMPKGTEDYLKGGDPDEPGLTDEAEYDRRCEARREWYASTPFENLREYNAQDCRILWHGVDQFETAILELGGQLQMTLASTGMHLFRRKYLGKDIETCEGINHYGRQAYTASRVEVFQSEIKDALYYDINSSFPHAMTYPHPGNYIGRRESLPDDDTLYLADCTIEVGEGYITPTPYRVKERIFFPIGKWRGWFNNVDINLLQREGGTVHRVHEVLCFESLHFLKAYAEEIYKWRMSTDDPFLILLGKLLLNCLYGKFAESSEKQEFVMLPNTTIPMSLARMVMTGVYMQEKEVTVAHVHTPISAHITAIARQSIFDFLSQCREIHYCDTDGFSTKEDLTIGKALGNLKLEKRVKSGHFVTPKVYTIEGQELKKDGSWADVSIFKAKGFSRVSAGRFARILEGEAIEFERMARIKELYKAKKSKPEEHTILKRMRIKDLFDEGFNPKEHVIPKRMTYPDGTTRPWHLDELKELLP